jgi:pullulanase
MTFKQWIRGAAVAVLAAALVACGGGGGGSDPVPKPNPQPPVPDARLEIGNSTAFATVLKAVPAQPAPPAPPASGPIDNTPPTLTVHYKRTAGDYTGWQIHTFNAAVDPGWNNGHNASGSDAFGAVYNVPLIATAKAGEPVGYLFHKLDDKDHGGADQSYTLKPGANQIWRIQGDPVTYTALPGSTSAPDVATVRVHYKRFAADYTNWGLHLWASNGMDTARLPAGVVIDQWDNAVSFNQMPGYAASASEVVFDIPVLNPQGDASRAALEFIIHGKAPNQNDKDGRNDNIRVSFASFTPKNQVIDIWLVQGDTTVYAAAPDTRRASTLEARAFWLNKQLIQWPTVDTSGAVKLYHSREGQLIAVKDTVVSGADGSVTLDAFSGTVPADAAERFKWIGRGAVFAVKSADTAQLGSLHKSQLVLVQEDAAGKVQNATAVQAAGALDDLYAAAENVNDLGVRIAGGSTTFKLWAPTAQKVLVFTYDTPTGNAVTVDEMTIDAATGVYSATRTGDLSGKYYKFAVEVFVRGVGLVRNLVTDPYALSLTTDSKRSYIADMNAPALKPAGWDASTIPNKVAAAPDMSIYELHVRDFSVNDSTVNADYRGKYLAFSEAGSNGMKHLKSLADAGLTDVHLLPVFDIASVPEANCTTPVIPNAAADSEQQQAAVTAAAGADCFNWGYDPYHYNAPEGSYASDAADGAKRIVEFRAMVKGLHDAGLRVGMDVVYNHTTASGQNEKAVLDRVVPGYYHRYNDKGDIERSTCCDNTATENRMMGKLMSDSVLAWARDYKIASFRFDIMGHQPRSVMEAMKTRLKTTLNRDVQLLGEGWNFGEVANGARFTQATLYSLPGSGIGSFNPWVRDAVRGGGPFTSGNGLVSEQGWINGLWYDPNASAPNVSKNDLMWRGDLIKAALAGSIKSYTLTTHWDATLTLDKLDESNGGAGYVLDPSEAVNYVENHDNQTLFDNNVFKLPAGTSTEDRARVQTLGAAIVAFSQGMAYYHAGVDTLRSKSLDRNSYDAGDWFNRVDWTYADNHFGTGLPRQSDNGDNWAVMRPFLQSAASIKPTASDIAFTRDAFRDLLKIRASTTLLRMKTADDIKQRLAFHNTGSTQVPTVLVGQLSGEGYAGAGFKEVVYLINSDKVAQTVAAPALANKGYVLHPVHTAMTATDRRAATASYTAATGAFNVPARTAVVFIAN